MKDPKFMFVSENLIESKSKGRESEYRVTLMRTDSTVLDKKTGERKPTTQYQIYFPKDVVFVYELAGKRIEFFVDIQKKAIGWKIQENYEALETLQDKRIKIIKPIPGGQWLGSVSKLVNYAKFDIPKTLSHLPVQKFVGPEYLQKGEIHYIQIP